MNGGDRMTGGSSNRPDKSYTSPVSIDLAGTLDMCFCWLRRIREHEAIEKLTC